VGVPAPGGAVGLAPGSAPSGAHWLSEKSRGFLRTASSATAFAHHFTEMGANAKGILRLTLTRGVFLTLRVTLTRGVVLTLRVTLTRRP